MVIVLELAFLISPFSQCLPVIINSHQTICSVYNREKYQVPQAGNGGNVSTSVQKLLKLYFRNILHSVLVGFQYQTFTHGSSQYQFRRTMFGVQVQQ